MRVTDHLYMLSGAPYGVTGNVYAILSEDKIFMIDAGRAPAEREIILSEMEYHGLSKYPVTDLLITHAHDDHMGNAWYFREAGAKVWVGREDKWTLENGGIRANDFGLFDFEFKPCKADHTVSDGDVFTLNGIKIRVYEVPGHTNGSVFYAFALDGRTMVATGDMSIPVLNKYDAGFSADLGWAGSVDLDKKAYEKSLERVHTIKADVLLGGHGVPVMRNGDHIIKQTYKTVLKTMR